MSPKADVAPTSKFIIHEGEQFKNDEEATVAAEAWMAVAENSGWIYKGTHKINNEKSEFEVVLKNSEPIPTKAEIKEESTPTTTSADAQAKETSVEE